MAKPVSVDGVEIPAGGGAVAIDEKKTRVVRPARPDEVAGNGHGGSPGLPVCPLLPNQTAYAGIKIFKGGGSKGAHVATINGPEVESLSEDYLRDTYAAEWGAGIYYLQGINAKGHAVPNEATQVNLSKPGSPTASGASPMESDLVKILTLQLSVERERASKQQELNQALILQMAKPQDSGMGPVLQAIIALIGANGKKDSDPVLMQMLSDAQTRARESEASMRELLTKLATNPPATADSKLLDSAGKVIDLAVTAAGLSGHGSDPTVEKFKIVTDGIKTAVADVVPIIADAVKGRRTQPALPPATSTAPTIQAAGTPKPEEPKRPARKLVVTQVGPKATPTPTPEPPNGNGNGAAHAVTEQPADESAPEPQPELATNGGDPVDPEVEALREIDRALSDPNVTAEDVARLFYRNAKLGTIPGWIVGPLASMGPEQLRPWPRRLALSKGVREIAEWVNEPVWSKLCAAVPHLAQLIATEQAQGAPANA